MLKASGTEDVLCGDVRDAVISHDIIQGGGGFKSRRAFGCSPAN